MYSSLSWIEWLERLDRVLAGARQDIRALSRSSSPRGLAALERSKRQLSALTKDLLLLDRDVLSPASGVAAVNPADDLQRALEAAVFRLDTVADLQAASSPAIRDRALAAIDSALRDSSYEAANLLRHAAAEPRSLSEYSPPLLGPSGLRAQEVPQNEPQDR